MVAFALAVAMLAYLDRVPISFASPFIAHDLHLSSVQVGYIFWSVRLDLRFVRIARRHFRRSHRATEDSASHRALLVCPHGGYRTGARFASMMIRFLFGGQSHVGP